MTCSKSPKSSADYEEIYIHAKVAIVDDAALTVGSANLNIRSMAFDSELNVLSDAHDVAYSLRSELFQQATTIPGPQKYADMTLTHGKWVDRADRNFRLKQQCKVLRGQLVTYHVDRQPGTPIV